jgi:gamma-tubulin complex component 5
VGLLRVLGSPPLQSPDSETGIPNLTWRSFGALVAEKTVKAPSQASHARTGLFSVSVDTLSSLIYEVLSPYCTATGAALARTIVEECELWKHIGAIEDLYFMRKGDVMSHFCDTVFAKVGPAAIVWFITKCNVLSRWTASGAGQTFISSILYSMT